MLMGVCVCVLLLKDSQVRQSATYSLHQPQGNKEHGTERCGNLYKKSDGWVVLQSLSHTHTHCCHY